MELNLSGTIWHGTACWIQTSLADPSRFGGLKTQGLCATKWSSTRGLETWLQGRKTCDFFILFSNVLCTKHRRKARIQGFYTKVTSALNCVAAMGSFYVPDWALILFLFANSPKMTTALLRNGQYILVLFCVAWFLTVKCYKHMNTRALLIFKMCCKCNNVL